MSGLGVRFTRREETAYMVSRCKNVVKTKNAAKKKRKKKRKNIKYSLTTVSGIKILFHGILQ